MRLWSIHPSYLDASGLVALWREGLLAQKVLQGGTKGYKNHPQLIRFKESKDPLSSISYYLSEVQKEAARRSYRFDETKIHPFKSKPLKINITRGQIDYEMKHLCSKLKTRDPKRFKETIGLEEIKLHPLFKAIPGEVESWERLSK
jgi:hypothetical protein